MSKRYKLGLEIDENGYRTASQLNNLEKIRLKKEQTDCYH